MEEDMRILFTFLENFNIETPIRILNCYNELVFEGKIGDVPQRISNMMSVVVETATITNDCLTLIVKSVFESGSIDERNG